MSAPDAAPELVPADPRARRIAIGLAVGLLVAGVVALQVGLPLLGQLARAACHGDRRALGQLRVALGGVLIGLPVGALAFAAYLGRLVQTMWRTRSYPPAGMRLLRPTRRLGPVAARRLAALLGALTAALAATSLALLVFGVRALVLLGRR